MTDPTEELALRFDEAEAAFEAEDFHRAGELWESIEDDAASRFNAGNAYRDGREFARAEQNYRAAIDLGELDAYLNLALLLIGDDRTAEAIAVLEKGAELGDSRSAIQLGLELADKDPKRAEAIVERFAEPNSVLGVRAILALARARLARNPSDSTVSALLSSASAAPEGRIYVADFLADVGRQQEAIDLYVRELARGVKEAGVPLGNLLRDRGDMAGAEKAFGRGVELGDNFARYNLGILLIQLGREEEGVQAIRRAAERGDDLAKVWLRDA